MALDRGAMLRRRDIEGLAELARVDDVALQGLTESEYEGSDRASTILDSSTPPPSADPPSADDEVVYAHNNK